MSAKWTYVIWGGLIGWDGWITSAGLTELQAKLAKFGPVKSYLQQSSYRCANEIVNDPNHSGGGKVVLIGYSGGSVIASRICNAPLFDRAQIVDLLVNIDGSPAANMQRVGDNVRAVINIYDSDAWALGGGIVDRWRRKGGGTVTAPSDTHVKNVPINLPHLAFQSSDVVHDIIVDAVGKL